MAKAAVTEKMRRELREKIAELTPHCTWYIIARDGRESIEWAYIRIDENEKAETFSDDGVSSLIYQLSRGRQLIAERTIKWLEENDLWMGARLTLPEEKEQDQEGKE